MLSVLENISRPIVADLYIILKHNIKILLNCEKRTPYSRNFLRSTKLSSKINPVCPRYSFFFLSFLNTLPPLTLKNFLNTLNFPKNFAALRAAIFLN